MAHLIGDLTKYFTFDEINIDNWFFKLYYKGCVILFFAGSLVGVLSQYFGEPIACDFTGIDSEVASDYCWIHGSSYIPPEYQPHMKCIVDLDGVESEDDAPDTSYYQWVTFMQLFQASLFLLPYKLWSMWEGGLMAAFGKEGKSSILLNDDEGSGVGDVVVGRCVRFFRATLHRNQWYFFKYLFCEMLYLALLVINFWAIDLFIQGRFRYYGLEVISYYRMTASERRVSVNPLCAAFPTEVSCSVPSVGAAGGEQMVNGLCVLSQNIINEKIYLVIWFYLSFLVLVSGLHLFYRLSTLFFDQLRFVLLYASIAQLSQDEEEMRRGLHAVLHKCYVGDWFVLMQLSRNMSPYFFREFVWALRQDFRQGNVKHGIRRSSSKKDTKLAKKNSSSSNLQDTNGRQCKPSAPPRGSDEVQAVDESARLLSKRLPWAKPSENGSDKEV